MLRKSSRRLPKNRKGRPLNVWVPAEQKQKLSELAKGTGVNQSEIVRKALELLFERVAGGQLVLGFPDLRQAGRN
jgi:hypothetical protein